ncbi:MAG: ABC transporter permease [Planctomycetota bacterium]
MNGAAAGLAASTREMGSLLYRYRKILWATTRVELEKRYAGSLFGKVWVILYPALLLSVYLFVFKVIFDMKLSADAAKRLTGGQGGTGGLSFPLYIFCGLIPYIGFSEAVTSGCTSIKQNLHLVKNVIIPIELIPVRVVAVSMVSQLVSMAILIVLLSIEGALTPHLLWLPLVVLLQVLALIGIAWIVSALGVIVPDVSHFVTLFVFFLMYVSPIIFEPSAVPAGFRFLVYLNPLTYMIEVYRSCLLYGRLPGAAVIAAYLALSLGSLLAGGILFQKFKGVLVDHE